MIVKYYILLCFILINIGEIYSIIVIPFQVSERKEDDVNLYYEINDFFLDNYQIDFYSSLYIGDKDFRFLVRISTDNNTFSLSEDECKRKSVDNAQNYLVMTKNTYKLHKSSSYKNISKFNNSYTNYKDGGIISEIFSFYNTTKLKFQPMSYENYDKVLDTRIQIDDMNIIIEEFTENNLCALIGLGKPDINSKDGVNFINELKRIEAINDYSYTYKFITSSSAQLIIGGLPHEYYNNSKFYKQYQYFKVNSLTHNDNNLPWSISFNKIFLEKKDKEIFNIQNNVKSYILPHLGFIIGTTQYKKIIMENYFNSLINEGICKLEKTNNINIHLFDLKNENFEIFTCDANKIKDIHKSSFPFIKFQQNDYGFIFNFSFYFLFVEFKETYYFLIIFPEETYINNDWYLGIPFLRRYQFIFNYDSKTIGFYNENIKEKNETNITDSNPDLNSNNNSYIRIIIEVSIGVLLIALIFVAFIVGRKLNNQRKKRANELMDDNYEYLTKENNPENNNPENDLNLGLDKE